MPAAESLRPEPARSSLWLVHRALLALFLLGLLGLAVELVLLKHTDGTWQLLPLVLLGLGLVVIGWYIRARSVAAIRALQLGMWLYVASGLTGTFLHFKGNVLYEQESNPGLAGRELYLGAVQGATPTLAPGAMIQLGCVGLLVAFAGRRLPGAGADRDA